MRASIAPLGCAGRDQRRIAAHGSSQGASRHDGISASKRLPPEQRRPKPDGREFARLRKDLQRPHVHYALDFRTAAGSEPTVKPFANLELSPAALVLHYGQTIFEGLKAYRNRKGTVNLFRAADNCGTFQPLRGAARPSGSRPRRLPPKRSRQLLEPRPRLDSALARDIAVHPAHDGCDRTLHRAQVHPTRRSSSSSPDRSARTTPRASTP